MRKLLRLSACLAFVFTATGQSYYTIQTVAGGGPPQNIQGQIARLGICEYLVVDAKGNVFLSLPDFSAVLRLDPSGLLTLVAGTGAAGFSGDNGPAASAQLNGPQGLALDSAGNLYIADNGNNRVRKVSNGVISTVAGDGTFDSSGDNGPATNAQLHPQALAIDSAGDLYVADFPHATIRKVSDGVITTVAGDGVPGFSGDNGPATRARLNGPNGIAIDSGGNLYIADFNNNRIRKVANGMITTVAGTGNAGFSGDNGPAAAAMLNRPADVAVDGAGNLFMADLLNLRIRRISNGVITTVAGNGRLGLNSDKPTAAGAYLGGPGGVAVDPAGNLYFTDQVTIPVVDPNLRFLPDNSNWKVYKVSSGNLITLAGSGFGWLSGSAGDNVPAVGAQLSAEGIAFDSGGNLYIADTWNHRVRKVSNGIVTTVAGNGLPGFSGDNGPATSARLNYPGSIAVDSSGSLYIGDGENVRVRKVSNGVITTVAGNGSPGFSGDGGPAISAELRGAGVAVDTAGNLYIADGGNRRIRRVSNGVITTVAGDGTPGFGGDNGPAVRAQLCTPGGIAIDAAGNLYIADYNCSTIRKVTNGVITTVVGTGIRGFGGDNGPAILAQLSGPGGIAIDSDGNLYISDSNRIRKVSNGVITTVAGNGTAGFSGDNGPATDARMSPAGVAFDPSGNLYISENNRVRVLTATPCGFAFGPASPQIGAAGGSVQLSIQTAPACPWTFADLPDWIAVPGKTSGAGPATATFVVAPNTGPPRAGTISITGVPVTINQAGAYIIQTVAGSAAGFGGDDGPATSAQLRMPTGVALDSNGNLYIADGGNNRIRIVSNGVITTVAGTGTAGYSGDGGSATEARLNGPGITVDVAGNLYIPESFNNRVRMVSNGVITTIAGNGAAGYSGDGDLGTLAQLNQPAGSAVDANGNLYFADRGNHRVRLVSNGVITTVAGTGMPRSSGDNGPATSAGLYDPTGVALDGAGNLYVAEFSGDRVRKISNGVITTIAGNGARAFGADNGPATSTPLDGPIGVAVDSAGNLYIAEFGSQRIRLVSNGIITTIAGTGRPGFSGDGGPATAAQLNGPVRLAVDPSGNIYIADFQNNRIRVLVPVSSSGAGNAPVGLP